MATLIPGRFGLLTQSAAERKLAERLERELGDEWTVLHSVGLVRHREKRWAEADFVLIGPLGLFVIEVKGGRVARSGGVWRYRNRSGHENTSSEGPFAQAGGAAGALQGWLGHNGPKGQRRVQTGYGVIIPDCELAAIGPDIEHGILLDGRLITRPLSEFVERLHDYWAARWFERNGAVYDELPPDDCAQLVSLLRCDFDAKPSMRALLRAGDDDMIRYTEDQRRALEAMDDNPRILVTGGAGSGKTMLAVAEARRLSSTGAKTLLACHNNLLGSYLAREVVDDQRITATTISRLLAEIVRDGGLMDGLSRSADDLWSRQIPAAAIQALESGSVRRQFNAVVIDEGQDLLRLSTLDVLNRILAGGLHDGVWRWFMDPNQRLFGTPDAASVKQLEAPVPVRFRLRTNCRNTRQVAELATLLSRTSTADYLPVSGSSVTVTHCASADVAATIASSVQALLQLGFEPHEVVLLLRRPDDEALLGTLKANPQIRLSTDEHPGSIRWETVGRFKGLEAPAVVLVGFDSFDSVQDQMSAYVAVTRGRHMAVAIIPSVARESYDRRASEYAQLLAAQYQQN